MKQVIGNKSVTYSHLLISSFIKQRVGTISSISQASPRKTESIMLAHACMQE
jgi:hypothetical protein